MRVFNEMGQPYWLPTFGTWRDTSRFAGNRLAGNRLASYRLFYLRIWHLRVMRSFRLNDFAPTWCVSWR